MVDIANLRSRTGQPIATLDDWRDLAGPASSKRWVDGRSAKCLAEWWLDGGSQDLAKLFRTEASGALADFVPKEAIAEAQTGFDSFSGGKRNHDLLVVGSALEAESQSESTEGDGPLAKKVG